MDYTPNEVGKMLNRSGRTIQRWIKSGKVPAYLINGRFYITQESVDKLKAEIIHDYIPETKIPPQYNTTNIQ